MIRHWLATVLCAVALVATTARTTAATDGVEVTQLVDDFSWPLVADTTGGSERGYRFYGRLAGDRGDMGGGLEPHAVVDADGRLRATAESGPRGTSWVGRWYSASHTGAETGEALSLARPLSSWIADDWQPQMAAVYVRVLGRGAFKVELKDADSGVVASWTDRVDGTIDFQERRFELSDPGALPDVKVIALVVESPAALEFDEIGLRLRVPQWLYDDPLRYAFATSYASLLRAYDPSSGYTRDHAHWPAGAFDAIPGCGFQILGAALAWDLGLLAFEDARDIARHSAEALAATPTHRGLLPHWLQAGRPQDWSTVDTGLALLSGLLGCAILELSEPEARLLAMVDAIDWAGVTDTSGRVTHGYGDEGAASPYTYDEWNGEAAVVQLLRLLADPRAPLFAVRVPEVVYGGRGFIAEIAGLFAPQFTGGSLDALGQDWQAQRADMLRRQRRYFADLRPGSLAARRGLYGLSAVETISPTGETEYLTAGVGTATVAAEDGGGWIAPHYAAMAGSVDPDGLAGFLETLRDLGVLQPLIGLPESVLAGNDGETPARWHSAQVSLNAFFEVAGLYHAIRCRDGGRDAVYEAARTQPRWAAALGGLFSAARDSVCTVVATGPEATTGAAAAPVLTAPYPNPANASLTFAFDLPRHGDVRLDVTHVGGQRVRTLVDGSLPVGAHTGRWDGRDEAGREVATGIYLLRLHTGEHTVCRRVVLLR